MSNTTPPPVSDDDGYKPEPVDRDGGIEHFDDTDIFDGGLPNRYGGDGDNFEEFGDGDDFDDFDDLPDLEDENGTISEDEAFEIAARVMSDEKLLDFRQSVSTLWFTCSAVQLAARHPGIGEPLRARLTEIGRVMQFIISDIHPDAERLIEMGWNPKNDR